MLEVDGALQVVLFALGKSDQLPPPSPRVEIHHVRGPRQTLFRPIWDRWMLPPRLRRAAPDLYFSPYGAVAPGGQLPSVITIHDVDFLAQPDRLPVRYRLPWTLVSRDWPRAAACLVPSGATREGVLALTDVESARVAVVPHGVDPRFGPSTSLEQAEVRRRFDLNGPFALWVGTREPRKNLGFLLEVFARLNGEAEDPFPLVLVGAPGWGKGAPSGSRPRWLRMVEGIDDATLVTLYGAASVFVFPSLDEGFGLPVIEAMACGTAVVAADAGSLPELVGAAALIAGPDDLDGWTCTVRRVLSDGGLRRDLERRGLARSREFSWSRAARETLAVFRSVV